MQTEKEKVLLTLILLVPFCLLVTGNPLIQIGLVCYVGLLLYLVIDRKFLINLKLPPIMEEGEADAKKELTGLSNVRESELRVLGGIRSTINTVQPPKTKPKPKSKPRRNKKIFGIPILALIIGLVVLGGASALIVNYLSNTARATVEVQSPLEINFANIDGAIDSNGAFSIDGSWMPSLTTPSITGLDTLQVGVKINNNADVNIEGKWLQLKLSNADDNVGCSDLTSISFMDTATPTQIAKGFQELKTLCVADPSGFVVYNIDINSLAAGQEYIYPAILIFGNVAPSTYIFEATLLDTIPV